MRGRRAGTPLWTWTVTGPKPGAGTSGTDQAFKDAPTLRHQESRNTYHLFLRLTQCHTHTGLAPYNPRHRLDRAPRVLREHPRGESVLLDDASHH